MAWKFKNPLHFEQYRDAYHNEPQLSDFASAHGPHRSAAYYAQLKLDHPEYYAAFGAASARSSIASLAAMAWCSAPRR
jgi:hypothetical protein